MAQINDIAPPPDGRVAVGPDTRYSQEVYDAAFLAWFENGHSIAKVLDALENDEVIRDIAKMSQWDPIPTRRQLTRWQQDWKVAERHMLANLAAEKKQMAVHRLHYASDAAAMTLARVAAGNVEDVAKDKVATWAADKLLQRTHPDANTMMVSERSNEIIDYDSIKDEAALFEAERKRREGS